MDRMVSDKSLRSFAIDIVAIGALSRRPFANGFGRYSLNFLAFQIDYNHSSFFRCNSLAECRIACNFDGEFSHDELFVAECPFIVPNVSDK